MLQFVSLDITDNVRKKEKRFLSYFGIMVLVPKGEQKEEKSHVF